MRSLYVFMLLFSGLTLSASLGVRDSNEASWSQVLDATEFMADASDVPILLDGDTGHGNFNNARRLVTKLETRGIAGVCFEDKLFPKTNSFISAHGMTFNYVMMRIITLMLLQVICDVC